MWVPTQSDWLSPHPRATSSICVLLCLCNSSDLHYFPIVPMASLHVVASAYWCRRLLYSCMVSISFRSIDLNERFCWFCFCFYWWAICVTNTTWKIGVIVSLLSVLYFFVIELNNWDTLPNILILCQYWYWHWKEDLLWPNLQGDRNQMQGHQGIGWSPFLWLVPLVTPYQFPLCCSIEVSCLF